MLGNKLWKDPFFWFSFVLGGFFLSLTLWYGAGLAQSFICYMSWVWKEYHLPPFVGGFNHNFPGIYLIGRLALELFGDRVLSLRILDLILQMTCLPIIFYLSQRLSGLSLAGFLSVVFYSLFYYGLSKDNTAHRETFIFCGLNFCVAISLVWENRLYLRAFLVGLILGFVFLLKPTYGLTWPLFGILFLLQGIRGKRKLNLGELFLFSLSCFLPSLMIGFYYWHFGPEALQRLYFANITFNAKIYSVMVDPEIQRRIFWTEKIPKIIFELYPLIFFSGFLTIAFQFWKPTSARDPVLFQILLAMLLICFLNYRIQGKYFTYHYVPFLSFLIIFSGSALGQIADWLGRKSRPTLAPITVSIFCLAMVFLMISTGVSPGLRRYAQKYAFRSFEKAYRATDPKKDKIPRLANNYLVYDYLQPLLKADDQIVCFGPYPLIPFLLKKKLPTYVPFVQHLLFQRRDGIILPKQKEMIQEYTQQVISSRPRFFLFSNSFTVRGNETFSLMEGDAWSALEQLFPELNQFLRQNYQLRTIIGEIYIYELKPSNQSVPTIK